MSIQKLGGRFQRPFAAASLAFLLAFAAPLKAADEKPATRENDGVGTVKQQTLKGFIYFYKSTETSFDDIHQTVEKTIPEMHKALAEGKVEARGPVVFIYHGVTPDPKAKFTLEIGVPVAEGAQAAGDFKVREVPEYHCDSVLYSGPLSGLGTAFEKLYSEAIAKGTGEAREMYLYFEGPESPNNVVHVSLGTKE